MSLQDNLSRIKERVRQAALRAGRDPRQIKIIAVSKKVSVSKISEALAAGVTDLGENRVQELMAKISELPPAVNWHMIGHLQTNKAKNVVGQVDLIHSLDRWNLAEEIDRRASLLGTTSRVLVQVNISGEETKFGITSAETRDFLIAARDLKNIEVKGLMTIAPYTGDPEKVRPYFRDLRLLAKALNEEIEGVSLEYLSMGMTNDFEVAVEEGANLLRLGTAIFGARIY